MCGDATWCSGWKESWNSLGRTSKPQVSVAIAAIPVEWSRPAVSNDRPGAGPPAQLPHPSP